MLIGRRLFCGAGLATLAIRPGWARSVEDHGLFWSITSPGTPSSTLFGYARVAASAAPSVVGDGQRFALQCGGLLGDVANGRMPSIFLDHNKLVPIYDRIPSDLAGQLRTVLGGMSLQLPNTDKISGLEAVFLLVAEGETPSKPTVGGAIFEAVQAKGRPYAFLLTHEQYLASYQPPDIVVLDRQITAETIEYLLKLRTSHGPIGRYLETLYVSRSIADLSLQSDELKAHGVVGFAELSGLPLDRLKTLMADRAIEALRSAKVPLFAMLPIGVIDEPGGVIAKARASGVKVELLA